jgi:hypothetical protein
MYTKQHLNTEEIKKKLSKNCVNLIPVILITDKEGNNEIITKIKCGHVKL